jgi:hypothetical protein
MSSQPSINFPPQRSRWYGKKKVDDPEPSPAGVAWATRLTEEQFRNVYTLAHLVDQVAEEARENERKRIFGMSFFDLCHEFWKGRKFHNAE